MGFKDAKQQVIQCLREGNILHEARGNIDVKNLLSTGSVSVEHVIEIIARARGDSHTSSPHHFDACIEVNIINTKHGGEDWYIKWYFLEPDSVFISVHH